MGLITQIGANCREVQQGNTYTWTTEPYITVQSIAVEDQSDTSKKIYEKQTVRQWRGTVHFSKTYSYVGLTKTAAQSGATTVLNAYTMNVAKWGVGIVTDTSATPPTALFMMVQIGSGTQCFAEATPIHVAGEMYSLEVHVNATIDMYSAKDGNAPTASQLKGLVSSIENFPEG